MRIFERGNRQRPALKDGTYQRYETGPNWFRCADGTWLSVIAGWGTYCAPRPMFTAPDDFAGPFVAVEAWFVGDVDPTPGVPAATIWAYVNEHGGLSGYLPPGDAPEG